MAVDSIKRKMSRKGMALEFGNIANEKKMIVTDPREELKKVLEEVKVDSCIGGIDVQ